MSIVRESLFKFGNKVSGIIGTKLVIKNINNLFPASVLLKKLAIPLICSIKIRIQSLTKKLLPSIRKQCVLIDLLQLSSVNFEEKCKATLKCVAGAVLKKYKKNKQNVSKQF